MKSGQKIFFGSKDENNNRRQGEVLSKSPHQRFITFLKMVGETQILNIGGPHPNQGKNNFVVP